MDYALPQLEKPNGILVLDKPAGRSSTYLLNGLKRYFPRGTKLGHAGTLDPFATGILLVLVGSATKRCESLMGQTKRYRATVKLGATTPTLDPTSPETIEPAAAMPTPAQLDAVLPQFVGEIQQAPPVFSALKREGKPAYRYAVRGHEIELAPRPVRIYDLKLLRYDYPEIELEVTCGRGTYIRALARDLAATLGTTGYVTTLCRTAVGPYDLTRAYARDILTPENIRGFLLAE